MAKILIHNIAVFDGSGAPSFAGEVLIDGNKIAAVGKQIDKKIAAGAEKIDGQGATLMPGLVEAHAHLSWPSAVDRITERFVLPPEEAVLATAHNARVLLDHGFTSAYSAGALGKRYEVAIRNEIEGGWLPGPRLRASTIEQAPPGPADMTGGHANEFGTGPEAIRKFVKSCAEVGIDTIKFMLSGEDAVAPGTAQQIIHTDEEVHAAAEQARASSIWLSAHAQASDAVKLAARNGFRAIYHCSYADDEALEALIARKDDVFVGPVIGVVVSTIEAKAPPHVDMSHMKESAEAILPRLQKIIPVLKAAGVRIVPGGDYGFPFNPNGRNARDLQHFVDYLGFTPIEALTAATKLGGELMNLDVGLIRPGYFADLLLVSGDPTKDVSLLQKRDNLLMIMKDGVFHKRPQMAHA